MTIRKSRSLQKATGKGSSSQSLPLVIYARLERGTQHHVTVPLWYLLPALLFLSHTLV
jgi:hypothetical protein